MKTAALIVLKRLWHSRPAIRLPSILRAKDGKHTSSRRRRDANALHTANVALTEAMEAFSQRFQKMSTCLAPLAEQSGEMLQRCEDLLSLAGGQKDGITLFQQAVRVLEGPLAYVGNGLQQQSALLALMERGEAQTQSLLARQQRLSEILSPLRHMVVLFKIESAHLDPEQQDTFITVASEIQRLRELIDTTFRDNTVLLRRAHGTLANVRTKLARDYQQHASKIGSEQHRISDAIQTLDTQLEKNRTRDIHLRSVSQGLNQEIVKLVTALQTQDILHQKCEHVATALDEGAQTVSFGLWARLQVSQVETTYHELLDTHRHLGDGFKRILAQANELEQASISLNQFDSMTAAADGMVQMLLDTLEETRDIIQATTQIGEDSHTAIEPVSDVTRNLSSTIEEVSINIRLIALNAQIRSVQIGAGSGLEVLAAHTAEISNELGQLGQTTAAEIVQLRETLSLLLQNLAEFRDHGRTHRTALDAEGPHLEARLHELRDRTFGTLESVSNQTDTIRASTQLMDENLAAIPQIGEQLMAALAPLRDCATSAPADPAELDALNRLARRYTMASERRVHDAVVAGAAITAATAGNSTVVPDPADALFDATPAPIANGETELGDNSELF